MIILLSCLLFFFQNAHGNPYSDTVYDSIIDITDPTEEEYLAVQTYIESGYIPHIGRWVDWSGNPRARDLKFFSDSIDDIVWKKKAINKPKGENKKRCVVLYASFNEDFQDCLKSLIKDIKKSDYEGYIIYRKGGWPNLEAGDLSLSHLPKAYKLCAIREAYRLGFEKVLWIDSTASPNISLNTIFDRIEADKIFLYRLPFNLDTLFRSNEYICTFGLTREQVQAIPAIDPRIIGIDLTDPVIQIHLNEWYLATKNNEQLSLTPYAELTCLSYVINKNFPNVTFLNSSDYINTTNPDKSEFTARPNHGKNNK